MRARDAGFEVIYQGIRLTPEQIVAAAVAEDVHCVGLSILSGSHMELVPTVLEGLREAGLADVPVIVGGIIPDSDGRRLLEAGVAAVYTPKDFGLTEIMDGIVDVIRKANGLAEARVRCAMAHPEYLVVGAGASGLAFVDSLVDHADDVRVTVVDRRPAPGGHWRDAYPFVRLHQASVFYGVASTELGTGSLQTEGPEAGLHERATATGDLRLLRPGDGAAARDRTSDGSTSAPSTWTVTPRECPRRRRPLPRAGHPGHLARSVRGRVRHGHPGRAAGVDWPTPLRSTSSWAPARRPPTRASGCSATASTPTRSAGFARASRGCSTAPWSSPTRPCSPAWLPTSSRPRPLRTPWTTCSSGSRPLA